MIYKVSAKFNYLKAKEFHTKLTDGTVQSQRPDGAEIIAAMNRATLDAEGHINWTEMCFCPSPLMHERATVYDAYFTDMKTESTKTHEVFEGKSFIEKLSTLIDLND